jgi:octaprenyl-diphosphate synthase
MNHMNLPNDTNTPAAAPSPAAPAGSQGATRALASLLATARRTPGLAASSARLDELAVLLGGDLRALERLLAEAVPADGRPITSAARHLLLAPGKRLRPMLTLLAGSLAGLARTRLLDAALAAELVHGATLLHDDVIDDGDLRRGLPAARVVWGNSVSVLAGDFALIRALERIAGYGCAALVGEALTMLGRMVEAEALQLATRGQVEGARERYWAVARGKTASLFEWAARAGAVLAGDLDLAERLGLFAAGCGVAFQIMDDVRDLGCGGDKTLFADLREGKVTLPVALALERDPGLRTLLAAGTTDDGGDALGAAVAAGSLAARVRACGAADEARRIAAKHVDEATARLDPLAGRAEGGALAALARSIVQ